MNGSEDGSFESRLTISFWSLRVSTEPSAANAMTAAPGPSQYTVLNFESGSQPALHGDLEG